MGKEKQVIQVNPRSFGKLTKQLVDFYNLCKQKKRVTFLMPEGEVLSPEMLKARLAQATKKAELNGQLKGISSFVRYDRKSFREETSIIEIDSRDILKRTAEIMAELQESKGKNK